ncbi:MAG: tetratricopeptide repeat protein [Pyrinomonadaceae bacterium]
MEKRTLTVALLSLIAGCTIGFVVANALNRREVESLRGGAVAQKPQADSDSNTASKLTDEEIQAGIRKADDSPNDLVYQRNMGVALYRYASSNKDVPLLGESTRLLKRVLDSDPTNVDINTALGNAYFDMGYFGKDSANFVKARTFYETALSKTPGDASLLTDYGLTYFLQEPPDYDQAVSEFEKALKKDPRNEKALEFSTQVYAKRGDMDSAKRSIEKLRAVNPSNPAIAGLTGLLGGKAEPAT